MFKFRNASEADKTTVAEMFYVGLKENPYHGSKPVTRGDCARHAGLVIVSSHAILRLACETDSNRVAGLVLAQEGEMFGTSVRCIQDVLLYVRPEDRGGGLSMLMLDDLHQEARRRGVKTITFPETASENPNAIARLCKDNGYTMAGKLYRLEL